MTQRNNTIDITKGLGIALVVLGHNWIALHEDKGILFRLIFSFHMPLFFFVSGIFLKESEPIKPFIFSKVDSLLKPYLVVLICVGIGEMLSHHPLWIKHIFGIVYGTGSTIAWEALWFLPHLFIALLFSRLFLNITDKFKYKLVLRISANTFFLIIGATFIDVFWRIDVSNLSYANTMFGQMKYLPGLPFSIDIIWISSAFIMFGFLMRQNIQSLRFNYLGFFGAILIFSLLHYWFDRTLDLNKRVYGDAIISSLKAMLGIYITISFATLMDNFVVIKKILAYLGSSSLFILIFHGILQEKSFEFLSLLSKADYFNSLLAFLVGIIAPIILLETIKRQPLMSAMLLPRKLKPLYKNC
ncbi:acyltransferase family protein [Chamaesiphon sp. GL140_3_metabinner_50]|uniref:acyltransferase family protein n=1 Tax=Chamaesiphon sp. GL140_3_metabinner_50 TaxID=2970812 RepID=UPI0025E5D5B7|nr:acyltransferase family protein [Chamaesiphon sp. GL140_3_metabinner_50]